MAARYLVQTAGYLIAIAGLLFLGAGDLRWVEAWVFIIEYAFIASTTVIWLARHDPDLLRERFASPVHRDQAGWDRAFLAATCIAFLAWIVLMGADAHRYAWSRVPVPLQVIGAVTFAVSMLLIWLVFRVNTFAVPQARAQAHRGQQVISTGPYAVVRHPMYSGAVLFFAGLPLLLGSWIGLAAGLIFIVALAVRSIGEEQILRRQLAGYQDYTKRVRWRLVPFLW